MATPNPERERTRLKQVLKQGLPRVVVILGSSTFFRTEAFDTVLEAVPENVDVRKLDGQTDTDGREIGDLRGGALFGGGNWLTIRRGDAWLKKHGKELETELSRIASGCGLVLELSKIDKRTKIGKIVREVGEVFEFRELYAEPYDRSRSPLDAEMVGWIVTRAKQKGMKMDAEAAFLLMSTVGREPAELVAEVDRLVSSLQIKGKFFRSEDLKQHLTCSFESTPFEFADAVLAYDRRRALRSLQAMYARGVKGKEGSSVDAGGLFPFITSWLLQSLTNAHEGRRLVDAGTRLDDVAGRVGVRAFADRFRGQVELNPERRLRRGLELLLDCQRQLRTTGEEPELLLERFLAMYFRDAGETAQAPGQGRAQPQRKVSYSANNPFKKFVQ